MIVEGKILLEFDIPTITGLIYPDELIPNIMNKIIHNDVRGIISNGQASFSESYYKNEQNLKCKVFNPQCLVDENYGNPYLLLTCDVDIDESKLTEDELKMLNTKQWRLSTLGKGESDPETRIVKYFDLMYVNIEIVDESYYN